MSELICEIKSELICEIKSVRMCDHQMGILIFQKFEKIILTTTVIILKSSFT